MLKLRCVIERITFQNPENGYSVMKVKVKGYNDLVTLVGNLLEVPVGSVLLCEGDWKVDKRFGSQFVCQSWEEVMPATAYGIEKYLGSGLVKGIGPKFAQLIVKQFGLDTIEVIETDIQRLYEVPGIGKKRVEKIRESWEKQKDIKNVMLFLQGYGVSTAYAAKIYRQYGKESIDKVKENPYRLADDIWGIGFKTADGIANKMGYEKNDIRRCQSGIIYTLNQLANEGHVYAEEEQLVKAALNLLEAEEEPIRAALTNMIQTEEVKMEEEAIYLPPFYFAEVGTANRLLALVEGQEKELFIRPMDLQALSKETGVEYDEVQLQAIEEAIRSKVMVLTGGPGTGKTTTTQGVIAALKHMGMRILLAAPTGRAAKRMSEATGMEAKTIHRLLEFNPKDGYKRNDENPLEGDALIVDECSMIDIVLMNCLMKAVPCSMRVVFVGDIDQLPSVGAGNVLRDLIDSKKNSCHPPHPHLPSGTDQPHCNECPCHQPGKISGYQQRKRNRLFLYPAGGCGKSSGGYCKLGKKPSAESLQPKNKPDSSAHAHATGCGRGCQLKHGTAKCLESVSNGFEQRRVFFPPRRPRNAATQQL